MSSPVPVLNRTQRLTKWVENNPNYFRAFIAFFVIVVLWSFITASFFLYTIHNPDNISPTAADVFGGFELTFAFIFGVLGMILWVRVNEQTKLAVAKYGNNPMRREVPLEEDEMAGQQQQQPLAMPQEESNQPVQFSRTLNTGSGGMTPHLQGVESGANALL